MSCSRKQCHCKHGELKVGRTSGYASIKVCVHDNSDSSPILNEVKMLRHLAQSPREHPGSTYARLADEIFELDGRFGPHYCLALRPQGCSLQTLQGMCPEGKVPKEIVMHIVQRLLGCVNWLFCDCDVIHTGWHYCVIRLDWGSQASQRSPPKTSSWR